MNEEEEDGGVRKNPNLYCLVDDYKSQQESIHNNSKGETKRGGRGVEMILKDHQNNNNNIKQEQQQQQSGGLLEERGLNIIRWQQQLALYQHQHQHPGFSLLPATLPPQDHVFKLHHLLAVQADPSQFLKLEEDMTHEQLSDQNQAHYSHNSQAFVPSGKQSKEIEDKEELASRRRVDESGLSLSLSLQQAASPLLIQKSSNVSSTNVSEISDQAMSSYSSSSTAAWEDHHHPLNLDLSISL